MEVSATTKEPVDPPFYHDPLPCEKIRGWLMLVPLIGFVFHEIAQNSLNRLLYSTPTPSLQRRLQIYAKQNHYYLYMLLGSFIYMQLFYKASTPLLTQLGLAPTPPVAAFWFVFYAIEIAVTIGKFSLNRYVALKHFDDASFYGKTLTYVRQ